jgi:hypothetical protein
MAAPDQLRKPAGQGATTPDAMATRTANRKYFLEQQARAALPRILGTVLSDRASTQKAPDALQPQTTSVEVGTTGATRLAPKGTTTEVWSEQAEDFPFDGATSLTLAGK